MSYVATRVKERIRNDYIEKVGAKRGFKLPTVKELASHYDVSLPTIGKAIEILAAEGAISKRRGSGIYIEELPPANGGDRRIKELRVGYVAGILQDTVSFQLLEGIEKVVSKKSAILELARSRWDIKEERAQILAMRNRGCQGVVLFPNAIRTLAADDYLSSELQDFNIVVADLYQPWMKRTHVIFDNVAAGYRMTKSLIEAGRTRIVFLVPEIGFISRSLQDRMEGYKKALAEFGRSNSECIVRFESINDPSLKYFFEGITRVISADIAADALILPFDAYVPVAIKFLRVKGYRIPDDILLVGFDNTATGRTEDWPTTNPDFTFMGERAAELLFDRLEGKTTDLSEVVLPVPILCAPHRGDIHEHESSQADIDRIVSCRPIGINTNPFSEKTGQSS
jgi:DNA-binding LacI/PurR family transcriptional regulator